MTILVTGGAGFIGQHVCRALRDDGNQVASMDLRPCGVEGVEDRLGSVSNAPLRCFKGVQAVVHLAAMVGVQHTDDNPEDTLDINAMGTRDVIRAAAARDVKHIVYASSSEVYGQPETIPTSEGCPVSPRSVYAVSKLAGEHYTRAARMPWTIVRPFNMYGPGQGPSFAVPSFIRQAHEDGIIVVHGDGTSTRAFCHVDDFARAILGIVNKRYKCAFSTYNIGNPDAGLSIAQLADKICGIFLEKHNRHIQIQFNGRSPRHHSVDVRDRCPNIDAIRDAIGWQPLISLEDGLTRMIAGA